MLKRFFIVFVLFLFNSLHTVAYHLNKEEFAHNIKYFLVFIFTINGSVLLSLAIDPIDNAGGCLSIAKSNAGSHILLTEVELEVA